MTFRIADTFTDSLARLTAQEAAAVKQTAFDLQVNPAKPGQQLHRVDRSRDRDFWTARVNRDIRIVLHKRGSNTLLAWVGHHDDAYAWAERRRLEVHPRTGAAQLVEIRERVEEVVVPVYVETVAEKPALFEGTDEAVLLQCGVPPDWVADCRQATEDTLLDLTDHLPAEAMEALLNLAVGVQPPPPAPTPDPFEHPDALRRFRLLEDEDELRRALDAPWDKWTIFLHPAQREFVTRNFNGPARITGSAGTGKTVVALHRAVRLARDDVGSRTLLTTYNGLLAESLRQKLTRLGAQDLASAGRIEILDLATVARREHERLLGPLDVASDSVIRKTLELARADVGLDVGAGFLFDEWRLVVDARNIRDASEYRDLPRHGRKTRLAGSRRDALWGVFATARRSLEDKSLKTYAQSLNDTAVALAAGGQPPFDHVVIDEAQDISVSELRFLKSLCGREENGLFFAGDIGQRIFRPAFVWSAEGVEIRGRSSNLRVNYRTSHQIRRKSDLLLPSRLLELDGAEEDRTGVQSVFEGPSPQIGAYADEEQEVQAVARWIGLQIANGLEARELGVLVRTIDEFERANRAIEDAGQEADRLVGRVTSQHNKVTLATMHLAKGLEFRAVAVMACDANIIPLEERLLDARDETALEEVYATERHLLYVACTRAREFLHVSGVAPVSEFLEDLTP